MQNLNIHLISDFTCETLMSISSVVGTQFSNVKIKRFFWPFIRNITQVEEIINSITQDPGVVLLSVLETEIEDKITNTLKTHSDCTIIPVMASVIAGCASHLNLPVPHNARKGAIIGNDYIQRIDAARFTINHDDGRMVEDLDEADIILIGVSRTSKSPTSVYLSQRGYKVANVPFISEQLMPNLTILSKPKIIGLIINAERLAILRQSRMNHDGMDSEISYFQIEAIVEELRKFRKYCSKIDCQVIDVSRKSIEEVVAVITSMLPK